MLVIDTTYFKRTFGVLVLRDVYGKENLFWKFVEYETIAHYQEGVDELKKQGFKILGITADGRRGIFTAFPGIPVQMCQFHQKQIVKKYITSNPILPAGIELKVITDRLVVTDKASFDHWLNQWFFKWKDFLNERTKDPSTGRKHFTHSRLRSAYISLRTNLPYLFTCEEYFHLKMPNTCNSLDGTFSHLKDKVRVHRGLKLNRKKKLIEELLKKK